ncbi:MAG: RagB/SusD family nutrient uptake outer membrane protein [Bacteroidia bacterium]|nr:RagB/SusD family nutrient uptake outer membrane protein [Bacteroidia bacterium]
MKFKYIISLFVIVGLFSCTDDFTDLAPISERNAGNFYNTAGDMEVAVNAIYNTLKSSGCYNQSYWVMQELRSDNTFWDATGLAEEITIFDSFEEITTSVITRDAWRASYQGIARANIVLNRIDPIQMDAGLKNQYIGEALFLRSLYYYHLAVAFGNVPLVLTETTSVEEGKEHVQVNAATVYAQLVTDLTTAESNLPPSYNSSNLGRATKGAAATLLAKVQLTLGEKGAAQTTLGRVMGYGYDLVDNYADLWGEDNEYNEESIFEVDFQGGLINQGNNFTSAFNGDLAGAVTSGLRNIPEEDLLDDYEAGDERLAASIAGTALPTTGWTIKYGTTNPFNDDDAPNNWVVFRYADVLLMMAEALGEGTTAYGHINDVRDRAGLGPIDASTPGTFEEKLLRERRVELAFENHRWADLLRFGVAESVMSAQGKPINGRLLFAIPQSEIDLNSNLVQNSGY